MKGTKKRPPLWAQYALDVLAIGLGLLIFSYFHHVMPVIYDQTGYGSVDVDKNSLPDWSDKFPGVFLEEGVEKTPTSYKSKNVSIELIKHQSENLCWWEADVYVRNVTYLRTAFAGGVFAKGVSDSVPAMAKENGAVLAVNGDYYGVRDLGRVIRNGVVYRDSACYQVCALYYDGTMETYRPGEFDVDRAVAGGVYQTWDFGPALLNRNGKAVTQFHPGIAGKNPRCAIGYYEPGHYVFVLADGRQEGYSMGFTLVELAELFEDLGCARAYNLDGGMSANMAFYGELVNVPARGGRNVSDIFYVTDDPEGDDK